jgi:hypothetical protein
MWEVDRFEGSGNHRCERRISLSAQGTTYVRGGLVGDSGNHRCERRSGLRTQGTIDVGAGLV